MEVKEMEISSVEELEEVISKMDPRGRVFVSYHGAGNIFEAAVVFRRLQMLVDSGRGHWEVDPASMDVLRCAAEHYEALGLLEIQLDLVDLDIKEGISMKRLRFEGVRQSANDVVTSAHPSSVLSILNVVTIEAQRIARVTKALGFGAPDVDFPKLTEDDLDWLAAEDVGGGAGIQIGGLVSSAPKLELLHLDSKPSQDGGSGVEVAREDGPSSCKFALHQAEVDRVGVKNPKDDCKAAYHDWMLTKEEHIVAILGSKISKLRAEIDAAKCRPLH